MARARKIACAVVVLENIQVAQYTLANHFAWSILPCSISISSKAAFASFQEHVKGLHSKDMFVPRTCQGNVHSKDVHPKDVHFKDISIPGIFTPRTCQGSISKVPFFRVDQCIQLFAGRERYNQV